MIDYPVISKQAIMIRFFNLLPLIEYLLTVGLFAAMVLNYLSMVNTSSKSDSDSDRSKNIRLVMGLVGLAFLAAILMIAISMINNKVNFI